MRILRPAILAAVVLGGPLGASAEIVLENPRLRLVLGEDAVWRSIESKVTGKVFNIAGPDTAGWDKVGKHLSAKTGKPYREVTIPNLWHLEFDISKARKLLGYDPQYTTVRMLDDSLAMNAGQGVGLIRP